MFFRRSPKKAPKDDGELLRLYRDTGEIGYLGELYERHVHLIFGVCLKYLKEEEASKDLCMLIFEKLVEAARSQEIRNFKSWLHVLTKNECLMLLRSRRYKLERAAVEIKEEQDVDSALSLHHTEEDALESKLQELEGAIEELPPEQKMCIRLFYLEQKCYKEIAEQTGLDLKAVKSHLQNGKRNLKIHMQNLDEES
ncbi:RNA polymerase sigma factor [Cesiribacter andamanensis]|uniref:RNA polymerase sigma factor n=1 Tax=Cesiribacter andamanensis AMV16 TaxID=1279009 RepID=M7NKM5_9BACT|nr:sigma-70 family RNA polymerase sigma factor [Cesiribacter andamanensis]EMR02320.1 RNA polymerase sigma factor [Cesiribacter andamanensis AMV16]